jgi:hypothetical protein
MKKILFLFIILVPVISFAQEFGAFFTKGSRTKEYVKSYIQKVNDKGRFYKGIPSLMSEIGDTLVYEVDNTENKFTLKLTFNLTNDSTEYYCDYQEFIFYCKEWSMKHFKSFFKFYSFKEIGGNRYLSKYNWKTELVINYKPNIDNCMVLTFRNVNKSKKDYKKYYKSLNKINFETLPFPIN